MNWVHVANGTVLAVATIALARATRQLVRATSAQTGVTKRLLELEASVELRVTVDSQSFRAQRRDEKGGYRDVWVYRPVLRLFATGRKPVDPPIRIRYTVDGYDYEYEEELLYTTGECVVKQAIYPGVPVVVPFDELDDFSKWLHWYDVRVIDRCELRFCVWRVEHAGGTVEAGEGSPLDQFVFEGDEVRMVREAGRRRPKEPGPPPRWGSR